MFREIIDRIKEGAEYIMKSRLMVLIIVFCLTSTVLIGRLFYLQIVRGEEYLENYKLQIRRTSEIPATRGNIYDRNGELIAYNELAYSVTIQDTVPTNTGSDEKNEILNTILDKVLSIVEANGDSVIDSFGIILDSAGKYQFAETNETLRLRFVADVYGRGIYGRSGRRIREPSPQKKLCIISARSATDLTMKIMIHPISLRWSICVMLWALTVISSFSPPLWRQMSAMRLRQPLWKIRILLLE